MKEKVIMGDMDRLEFFSRDLDKESDKNSTPNLTGTFNYDLDNTISPCLSCKNIIECPDGLSTSEMESLRDCDHYIPVIQDEIMVDELENRTEKTEIKLQPIIITGDVSKKIEKLSRNSKKQELFFSILSKWREEQGQLRVVCIKCEAPMIKRMTLKKEYYYCPNFPECNVQANPIFIAKAIMEDNGIATNKIKADKIVLYRYDDEKNIITVSEIYSDKKIFM